MCLLNGSKHRVVSRDFLPFDAFVLCRL